MESGVYSEEDVRQFAVALVGKEHVPERALASLADIGTVLVGRPQLAGTVSVSAGYAPYVARNILLGGDMKSGRYYTSFDQVFL